MKHSTVFWYVFSPGGSMLHGTEGRDEDEAIDAFMRYRSFAAWQGALEFGYTVRRVTVEWES